MADDERKLVVRGTEYAAVGGISAFCGGVGSIFCGAILSYGLDEARSTVFDAERKNGCIAWKYGLRNQLYVVTDSEYCID